MPRGDHAVAMRVDDQQLVIPWEKAHRRLHIRGGSRRARQIEQLTTLLVREPSQGRRESPEDGADARGNLSGEMRDVREARGSERGEIPIDQVADGVVLTGPRSAGEPRPCGYVWRIRTAVRPVPARRRGHEIRMRAHETPDEPPVRTAEGAEALREVRDDVLLQPRLARECDCELRKGLRIHPLD